MPWLMHRFACFGVRVVSYSCNGGTFFQSKFVFIMLGRGYSSVNAERDYECRSEILNHGMKTLGLD